MDEGTGHREILPSGGDFIAQQPFIVLNWVFVVLCTIAFTARVYIRYVCFHRFLFEDYLMLVALILHNTEAVLIQLFLHYAYDLEAVQNGDLSKFGPNFFTDSKKAFIAVGASINITIVGVFIIKLNFLLFFKRLVENFRSFTITWWAVTGFTAAITICQIGMQEFGCFFGSIDYTFGENCTSDSGLKRIVINAIFSATVDAISDFLIIGFPIFILWGTRLSIRKKIILTFIFGLVFFTIAITILRGSIFHDVYNASSTSGVRKEQSMTFTWFWFYCEFSVAFIIACIVSFRTLFVQASNRAEEQRQQQLRREEAYKNALNNERSTYWRLKAKMFQHSLFETCKEMEGAWSGDSGETLVMGRWLGRGGRNDNNKHGLPTVPSGLMTVDFNDDSNWSKPGTAVSCDDSVVMKPAATAQVAHSAV